MPFLEKSSYTPPYILKNTHLQTILPTLFRKIKKVRYSRERIDTPDKDFIDLDWQANGNSRCAILIHGLEGHSHRAYVLGMARAFSKRGWDTVSMNLRGCSGEPNRQLRFYHHGVTDDLYTVIKHVVGMGYTDINITGFSLGANMILKYLGEKQFPVPRQLSSSVAISAPCDLVACALRMDSDSSEFYRRRFLNMLLKKMLIKKKLFPDKIDIDGYQKIKKFREFDDRFTAPIHGFYSARDYYEKAGSLQFLKSIESPVLVINAKDDPFLTPGCFPLEIARRNNSVYFEIPENGGHMGFVSFNKKGEYWHESRTLKFVKEIVCK